MRYTVLLLALFSLAGCGALFHYAQKTPVDYVQLYPGTKHDYQMRLQYRVRGQGNPHNPITLDFYDYMWSDWIPLYGSGSVLSAEGSQKSCCPEDWVFGCSPYDVRGVVNLIGTTAKVVLEIYQGGNWKPYEFNGEYRVERPTNDPVTEALAQKADCSRKLSAIPTKDRVPSNTAPQTDAREAAHLGEQSQSRAVGRER